MAPRRQTTHATIVSGPRETAAREEPDEDGAEPFTGDEFARLDGENLWSQIWAVLPPPRRSRSGRIVSGIEAVDLETWPDVYIQIAGRDGRFTVEVREAVADDFRQLVLGRSADEQDDAASEPSEPVSWGEWSVTVHPHEVWTAEQARVVFRHWYLHDALPPYVTRREIHL